MEDASTDGSRQWLSGIRDERLQKSYYTKRTGHPTLYDIGFRLAETEYVGIIHSDMVVSPNFINTLSTKLHKDKVISATCVEPPLHGEGFEKIVNNFGAVPPEFNVVGFNEFANEYETNHINVITPSLFAPWFVHRETYFNIIGGHDPQYLPVAYDDSDLFIRMKKGGFIIEQCRDILVYHFTQRGAKWNSGKVGVKYDDYDLQVKISENRFLTKWGTLRWKDEYHHPSDIPLLYKQLNIKNYNLQSRNKYEPLNLLFNRVVADGQCILTDRESIEPNYIITLDYNVNYDLQSLIEYLTMFPFVVLQYDPGKYEYLGLEFEIKNLTELPIKRKN
jgi:hypothetical protein